MPVDFSTCGLVTSSRSFTLRADHIEAYLSRPANQLTTTIRDEREVASAGIVLIRKRRSGATSKGMNPVTRVSKSGTGTPGSNDGRLP
jgi:hypothetical protein